MRAIVITSLLLGLVVLLGAAEAGAQGTLGTLTYDYAVPSGDTHDFIENDSWFGATLAGRRFTRPDISFSFSAGFNEFHDTDDRLIEDGNLTISGEQYRNLQVWPFLVGAQKWFGDRRANRIAAGASVGTTYVSQLLDIGLYSEERSNWHFTIVPEISFLMPAILRDEGFAVLSLRYSYNVGAGDYLGGDSRSWSYLSIGLGFGWQRY